MTQESSGPLDNLPPRRPILVYVTQAFALAAFADVAIRFTHRLTRAFSALTPNDSLLVKQAAILLLLGSLSFALATRRRWGWHVGLLFISSLSALMVLAIFVPLDTPAPDTLNFDTAYHFGEFTACVLLVAASLAYPLSWFLAKSVRRFFRV